MVGIYLDNAATSFPKPPAVWEAMDAYHRGCGASAGRGGYAEAFACARTIAEARERVARLINAPDPSRVVFCGNATGALNLAIKGVLGRRGGHAVTSAMEHNSVLRPLHALRERGLATFSKVTCGRAGELDPEDVRDAIRRDTRLMVFLHASNVCGAVLSIAELAKIARAREIPLLVDAAQTAGSLAIDVQAMDLDMVAMPGHKGLMGPLGTGALWVRDGLEIDTTIEGGTGSVSELEVQPDFWPDRHEPGSHNAPGLAGLSEGVAWVLAHGADAIRAHKEQATRRLIAGLCEIDGVTVYGPLRAERNAGVVSITAEGWEPLDLARELDERFGVKVRPGLHCAPGAHRALGTIERGTVRFSVGPFTTDEDVDGAVAAVEMLARERLAVGRAGRA